MRYRIIQVIAGISLLLALGLTAIGVRSYRVGEHFQVANFPEVYIVHMSRGGLELVHTTGIMLVEIRTGGWKWRHDLDPNAFYPIDRRGSAPRRLEFSIEYLTSAFETNLGTAQIRVTSIVLPVWLPVLLLFTLSALLLLPTVRRLKRRRSNACTECGYDLRMTPDRCPECGTVPVTILNPG